MAIVTLDSKGGVLLDNIILETRGIKKDGWLTIISFKGDDTLMSLGSMTYFL